MRSKWSKARLSATGPRSFLTESAAAVVLPASVTNWDSSIALVMMGVGPPDGISAKVSAGKKRILRRENSKPRHQKENGRVAMHSDPPEAARVSGSTTRQGGTTSRAIRVC